MKCYRPGKRIPDRCTRAYDDGVADDFKRGYNRMDDATQMMENKIIRRVTHILITMAKFQKVF